MTALPLGLCGLLCLYWLISLIGYHTRQQRWLLSIAVILLLIIITLTAQVLQ